MPNLRFLSMARLLLCLSLLGCANGNLDVKFDKELGMEYDDMYNVMFPKKDDADDKSSDGKSSNAAGTPALPPLSSIIAEPTMPKPRSDKLVSMTVTDDIPLKDVLLEIVKLAELDAQIDPTIKGGIILKVKDKPLSEVLDRVAYLGNLRYTVDRGTVKIERDKPYLVSYDVDFLSIKRTNKSSMSVSMGISGSASGSAGSASSNNASSSLDMTSDDNLWESVETNLKKMIEAPSFGTTSSGPGSTASASQPFAAAQAVARTGATPDASASAGINSDETPYISINKSAGIINVVTTFKKHKEVKQYLERVRRNATAQVLIEAKIVAVNLTSTYSAGIDWRVLDQRLGFLQPPTTLPSAISPQGAAFTMGVVDTANWRKLGHITNKATQLSGNDLSLDNFSIFAKFLEEFGTTRTLSSPRIMAINNQQAILSFAKNQVYFTITAQNTPASTVNAGATGTPATTTVNSTANAVPLGVILVLQPSINMETEEITMHIRPTLSTSVGSVNDPAVAYIQAQNQNASGLSSAVPIVQVKEMDSVMRMKSGQVVVLGGMIDDEYDSYDGGLPGISKLPIIGNLFKTSGRNKDVTQTVIFIRATIMPANNYPKPDKEFYDKFAQDQRYSL